MEQDILGRITQFKNNVQHFWDRFSDHELEMAKKKITDVSHLVKEKLHKLTESDHEVHSIHIDNYQYESHYPDDDLPLTLSKDSEPGIRFYDTENSPLSAGAPKSIPRGIDKFDDENEIEVLEEDVRRPARKKKKVTKKRHLH